MAGHRKWVPGPRPAGCEHWLFPEAAPDDPRKQAYRPEVRGRILAFDDKDRPVFAFSEKGMPVCGHILKNGKICHKADLRENGRCESHATRIQNRKDTLALSSMGYIPRLADKIEEALSDPELVSARNAIATYEAMIREVGEEMGDESPAEMWFAASDAWSSLASALESMDEIPEPVRFAMEAMSMAFRARSDYQERESKIRRLMMEQLAHKKEERELMKAKEQFLTARDMLKLKLMLERAIRLAIEAEIPDADTRNRIFRAIQSGLARASGGGVDAIAGRGGV